MVAFPRPDFLKLPAVPVTGAYAAGLLVSFAAVIVPDWRLEVLVEASGLPAVLPVAAPPLGLFARLLLALAGGGLAAAVTWSVLVLLTGPEGAWPFARSRGDGTAPTLRRADAHPDAPARWPLSASDLGPPLSPPGETTPPAGPPIEIDAPTVQDLPADLDQPLAAFDPSAMPAAPREPVRPVTPLVTPPPRAAEMAPGERLEIFQLTPPPQIVARAAVPRATSAPAPSIAALLQRLERSVAEREPAERPAAPRSLEDTLGALREMAKR